MYLPRWNMPPAGRGFRLPCIFRGLSAPPAGFFRIFRGYHPHGLLLSTATKVTKNAAIPTVLTPFGCVVFVQVPPTASHSRTGPTFKMGSLSFVLGSAACRALAHCFFCSAGSKAYWVRFYGRDRFAPLVFRLTGSGVTLYGRGSLRFRWFCG